MVGSLTGKIGGAFFTPYWTEQNARPDDMFLEPVVHTLGGTEDTLTLLTHNTYIDYASFVYPIVWSTTPSASSITLSSSGRGVDFVLNGANNSKQMVYIFGSIGKQAGRIMCFPQLNGVGQKTRGVVWEILYATMDSSAGTYILTASSLDHIDRPLYVLATEVTSTVPDTGGYSLNALHATGFTVECGNSKVLAMLVGGLSESGTVTANATDTDQDMLEYMPLWLGGRNSIRPGDLIGEIVTKTFVDGTDQSLVTVTAASDCEIIRHIELVIPVCANATEYPVGWSGTQGATSIIYTKNACTDNVYCLVLGY